MKLKFISILYLLSIAAQTSAMDSQKKITDLMKGEVVALAEDEPITDKALFKKNPSWKVARSWSQGEKNQYLNKALELPLEHVHFRVYTSLAVAIGADPNLERGYLTPLQSLLVRNEHSLACYLLEKGADPNKTRPGIEPPLRIVNTIEMTEVLLAHGADPKDILFHDRLSPELMEFYLKRGVRPKPNKRGLTPLHAIALETATWGKKICLKVSMLIKANIDLCAKMASNGDTALHVVAKTGCSESHLRPRWTRDPSDIDEAHTLCATILAGCSERHQRYWEFFTLLCCLRWTDHPLYAIRDFRAYFKLPDSTCPLELLTIENNAGETPYQIWNNEILNPDKFANARFEKK
jgi:hypothetical protein